MLTSLLSALVVVIAAHAAPSSLPAEQDEMQHKAIEFLNTDKELRGQYSYHFTGRFRPLPEKLQQELRSAFPRYNFLIAEMIVSLDFPPKRYDLVLVTNATAGETVSYIWGTYWTLRPSTSFKEILKGQQAQSAEEAISKVHSLAQLLVYAVDITNSSNDAV